MLGELVPKAIALRWPNALASIDDLRSAGTPVPESSDCTTAAGFFMTTLGAVPKRGSIAGP